MVLATAIANIEWRQIAGHLSVDPATRWALAERNAPWAWETPPLSPSPHERFERMLLAQAIGQELDERDVYRQREQADMLVALTIAGDAMRLWRRFCEDPASAPQIALRRLGRMVRLAPALDHLQYIEAVGGEANGWPRPLRGFVASGLTSAGLASAARSAKLLDGLMRRIDRMVFCSERLAYEPSSQELYQHYVGLSGRRYEHLMEQAAGL